MALKGWDKVSINSRDGKVEGIAPVIISASRATDLPAFYADWFFNRLKAGYVKWVNPFNQKPQFVSFEKARVVVFWTKNARPILPMLKELDERNLNYYFTFTVNAYEEEGFEPGLPPLKERLETFQELSERVGRERVIWRFDPLILTDKLEVTSLLDKISTVGEKLSHYTDKLVVSFADIETYGRVRNNLKRAGVTYREFDQEKMLETAQGIQLLNKSWKLKLATCSEGIDLSECGFQKNRCIDGELMIKLFSHDKVLMNFLGYSPPAKYAQQVMFREGTRDGLARENADLTQLLAGLKDKGQRENCGCIISKDIGQYNTCNHKCLYCYANSSPKSAERNFQKYLITPHPVSE